ncbi:MAG: zinc-binding dehydrogenase [Elusimicrobia bacterium]|nr:zinc-binding dehydrogenase [Elusimicrobiota bacterium]
MQAVIIDRFGGPETLKSAKLPDPEPEKGEALVRVRACALNHLDLFVRDGIPAYKIALPHILGCDVAGEVAEVGEGVSSVKKGDRVAVSPGRSCGRCESCLAGRDNMCKEYGIIGAQGGPGGYAEYLRVPEAYLLALPGNLSFEEGAAYPLTFLTAWHMLMTLGGCGPDSTVLILGAGSGVGVAAIQVAKLSGAFVIASSTSEEKLEKSVKLGADAAIHSPPQDIMKSVHKLTKGGMADIAVEHVGPAVFDAALKSLKTGGRLVTCGSTTGPTVELDMRYVFSRQLQILGSKMGTQAEMREVARLVAAGRLKPVVDRTFPLSQARQAHEYLAQKKQFGKVVLTV